MTSSVHGHSDGCPDDNKAGEEQKSEPQHHSSSPANEISYHGVRIPNLQYMTSSQIGEENSMAQAAYPYPYYRSIFSPYDGQPYPVQQPYDAQQMVHLQLMGIQQADVSLPSDAVEEPAYVNAKQYHGILRRRQIRAKAESQNKVVKSRKPYLHESRHQHALRRARGCGGRFLNSKKNENKENSGQEKYGDKPVVNLNLNSDKNELDATQNASQ